MKKALKLIGILILLVLVLGVIAFLVVPRQKLISYLAPTIENIHVTDTRIDEENATMQVQLGIKSGLVPVFIDSLSYDLRLYDKSVAHGHKSFERNSQKGKSQTLTLPVSMNHNQTRELVRRQVAEDEPVDVNMDVYCDLPLFGRQHFDLNERLDMVIPALPGMEVSGLRIEDVGLDTTKMVMTMRLDNPNEFAFYIKNMKFDLQLSNYMTSVGGTTKDQLIKAHDITEIQVPAVADPKKPLKAAFKLLKGDDKWPYTMKSYMEIEPKSEVVGTVKINSVKTGTVDVGQQIKKLRENKKEKKEAEKQEDKHK
jgi:LEA14-like dessication related protein